MIPLGTSAPAVRLDTQFILPFDAVRYHRRSNVLLLFYPLDFTPICTQEVPQLEALADLFAMDAKTQVAAVSVDSRFSHAAWGAAMGGISIPLLADCNPQGALGAAFGAGLPAAGVDDRATVILDAQGVVRYAKSVGINGKRNMRELLAEAVAVASAQRDLVVPYERVPLQPGERFTLYGTQSCHQCRYVYTALVNLRIQDAVTVISVDVAPGALAELRAVSGRTEVPLLVAERPGVAPLRLVGSTAVIEHLARRFARMRLPTGPA